MLASGWSAVYPCHVTPREMRSRPIGTGPFKLVEFKPNEGIKVARNRDYWKKDRPYLDGIEYTIIKNASTRVLAFIAGKFDMTTPFNLTIPLMRDIQSQAPQANCVLTPTNVSRTLIVNRDKPPFGDPDIRRALALTLDRKAFIDTINEGKADIGGAMLPPPEGIWGMPTEMLRSLPGYDPDVAKNRAEARKIMAGHGYGPDNRLKIVVSTRNIPQYRDPAVILIDQLKQIYIDGDLEDRHGQLVSQGHAQGLHHRAKSAREWPRRPRPDILRELCMRRGAQLHGLLQPRGRTRIRPAVDGSRSGKA
jgi:peptide/nickel transport system substrate-binding protein